MRLLNVAALGFMLPAVSQACSGFLNAGCKIVEVNDRDMPKYLNLIADCPDQGGILKQPLKFNIFNGDGFLRWLRNGLGNIMDCTDFDVTESGGFSATCNGKRTNTLELNDHIALINDGGNYALCPNNACCSDDITVGPKN